MQQVNNRSREEEIDAGVVAAPVDASAENKIYCDVMLFNCWTYDDVQVSSISLHSYNSFFSK